MRKEFLNEPEYSVKSSIRKAIDPSIKEEIFPHMEYAKDSLGQEILLKEGKFQVMMEWEKPYMQSCIDALKPFGDVLEVGFGCGYSATHIQTYHPKSHTIIEYHPTIAQKARKWAEGYSNVIILEDTWQNALPHLGVYDCIFFDDYPLESERETHEMQRQVETSSSSLQEGRELLSQVEQTLPFLKAIEYTKTDMHFFFDHLPQEKRNGIQLIRFLTELKIRTQITEKLFEEMIESAVDRAIVSRQELSDFFNHTPSRLTQPPSERLMQFLSPCLKKHMRKNSRFSCFLSDPTAPWENPHFFNEVIINPHLDFQQQELAIEVPSHCTYYTAEKALVITIEKMQ